MFRNYLLTAVRNLARHRLHSAITLASLAIGFTGVLLVAVYWRYETTYDRFWPNAERAYLVAEWRIGKDFPLTSDAARNIIAPRIAAEVAGVEAVARLLVDDEMGLQRGDIDGKEEIGWADPNLFQVLTPTPVTGDLSDALSRAGSIVLTRSLARKYFADADPVGQTLLGGPEARPMTVTAVIEDLPSNGHLGVAAFVSGAGADSPLQDPKKSAFTYLLARPGVDRARLADGLEALARRLPFGDRPFPSLPADAPTELKLLGLGEIYLKPEGYGMVNGGAWSMNSAARQGDRSTLTIVSIFAALIMVVAGINFITLMTARGAGRAVEVGVRKVAGARRSDLVVQFVGEGLIFALVAVFVAFASVELVLPLVNKLTDQHLTFDYSDLRLTAGFIAGGLGLGLLGGVYPAFALSAYRPALVLKGGRAKTPGSARLRQIMVAIQFMPLIVLALAAVSFHHMMVLGEAASLRTLDPRRS
jgi:putative ABC transport system permease protein